LFCWSLLHFSAHTPGHRKKARAPEAETVSEKTGEKRSDESYLYQVWQWATHDAITVYTFFLAIFTGALVGVSWVQIRYLNSADKTAQRTAEAAKKSADALPTLERAYVFLTVTDCNFRDALAWTSYDSPIGGTRYRTRPRPSVQFKLENHGKTPAVIKELSISLVHWAQAPDELPFRKIWYEMMWSEVLRPEAAADAVRSTDEVPLTPADVDLFNAGSLSFFFFGRVIYEDIFRKPHTTEWCWRYSQDRNFAPWGGEKHNYRT